MLEQSMMSIQGANNPLGGYQHHLLDPRAGLGWPFNVTPKLEPMDENKNESGAHSPSRQNDIYASPQAPSHAMSFYSTPQFRLNNTTHQQYNSASPQMYTQTPPTPPDSEPMVSPKSDLERTTSPDNSLISHNENSEEAKKNQQNEDNKKMEKDENEVDEMNYEDLKVPRLNSHGKVKQMRCKQCSFVAITKESYWKHAKEHIREDKQMCCPKCPFVTEYKHHMEYHIMNHSGVKPYSCSECNYKCVSKSMLASHMKSHSNIYQYRCANCSYATKYIHSLKQHCRKHKHKAAMVLNPDGTPNPVPVIDVYGSRRGPKLKQPTLPPLSSLPHETLQPEPIPFGFNYLPSLPLGLPILPSNDLLQKFAQILKEQAMVGSASNFAQILQQQQAITAELAANPGGTSSTTIVEDNVNKVPFPINLSAARQSPSLADSEVLDLSVTNGTTQTSGGCSSNAEKPGPSRNRRKGPAYRIPQQSQNDSSDFSENENDEDSETEGHAQVPEELNNNQGSSNTCTHCEIIFGDPIMYSMHMGLHGYGDPFTCNICGEKCETRIAFFLHVTRISH